MMAFIHVTSFANNQHANVNYLSATQLIPYEEVILQELAKNVNIKSQNSIKNWALNTFEELKNISVTSEEVVFTRGETFFIYKYGKVTSYKVDLMGDLPTGLTKQFYLIYNSGKREACLIPLNSLRPIIVSSNGKKEISGTIEIRAKAFYIIYEFSGDRFKLKFNTINFCKYGIVIGLFSDECIQYRNSQLVMNYQDLNRDQIDDVIFTGIVEYYCKPNVDRNKSNNIPLRTEVISISFISTKINGTIIWELKEENICDKIPMN
jgi:hypothetical protein